ncbi:tyrosine-type recombinase/integrase [Palleronia sp. THAF1]|uniref:tyrosine-type recombinase/integrase n=1 Tax=Palleronia sp. THAF1 TaxID=2587842 RepID=UPI000F51D7BF
MCATEPISGDSITYRESKTPAGNRIIPIHNELKSTISRLLESQNDDFLLSGLVATKHGTRSDAIGKRFGRLKIDQGHGPSKVFHSIRKTVATLLEQAGVPENISADILGHQKNTMTYGLYSGGTNLNSRLEAINLISYS